MSDLVIIVTKILAVGTVYARFLLFLAWLALAMKNKKFWPFSKGRKCFSLIVVLAGMITSLFYSLFANFRLVTYAGIKEFSFTQSLLYSG